MGQRVRRQKNRTQVKGTAIRTGGQTSPGGKKKRKKKMRGSKK